ncbi:MAG TPA: DUF1003 domain-containing protein [Dermatophilaceae bacterium]|jgi:uncharacterized membrane protein|uniref:DUF1003 domain-containing protein n=1 Tax=Candidatus Phosphoribacter hodrii TaxID=2953743 RepID=A0A935CC57_9MICO|nr:DUF1003 domain-containing protein [Candidatus Phosphoribacter hodrii]MBP8837984.1 DUF1003 domain-containing protein [Dermatophilaceae bacterium]OPZ56481.1 MAG: hypothetical protein BWY91_00338 [bacterium ADurb.BinA028]MBL0004092.1 DUF1003 domain-containing protein [Candidatus Phosphoribacter hodrii]HOA01028.1 DUF1003 domain-containing protein [Dermatophilaceae bacterium]
MADRRRPNRTPGRGRGARLDQPREFRRRDFLPGPGFSQESFGVWSEQFARFMGTPLFLIGLTAFAVIWIGWNTWAPVAWQFDPRELNYTLLTLLLSLQASYAAPLILLAQNRQADRDRVTVEQDRARDERNLADTEYLTREVAALRLALREVATRDFVRSELRALLQELDERAVDERTVDERTVDERATTEPSSSSPRLPSGTGERRSD